MTQIQDRIIGTEMEYGLLASKPDQTRLVLLPPQEVGRCAAKALVDLGVSMAQPKNCAISQNYFLGNGARIYADVGMREYATPEDTTAEGALANEMVGETIIEKTASIYAGEYGFPVLVEKSVIDEKGETWGYHANYSADASKVQINEDSLALFGVFAATRSILFGTGSLRRNGNFTIGQKILGVGEAFSNTTTQGKPVVNLRNNDHHANTNRWVRVHDTSGDPTMSPWATAVKFGAASIVLRLIENDMTLDQLRFDDRLDIVARQIATDVSLSNRFKTTSGESVTAIEVHKQLIAAARQLEADDALSPTEMAALQEWDKAIGDLERNPRLLMDRVDWITKLQILKDLHDKYGWGWQSKELRAKDVKFNALTEGSIGLKLREGRWAKHMPSSSLIKERERVAPRTTRAHVRGMVIRKHYGSGCSDPLTVDWAHIQHGSKFSESLSNPFATSNGRIEDHFEIDASAA